MTTSFTQNPLVIFQKSGTGDDYVFAFEYTKTSDISVYLTDNSGQFIRWVKLVEGVHYTISPVAGPGGTLTIINDGGEVYNYVILRRGYGYGQEFVMPVAYSSALTQTALDGLGLQTQQLQARLTY